MGLGILEDHVLGHVPGTANVLEDERTGRMSQDAEGAGEGQKSQGNVLGDGLKYDKTGKILLVPQPSDDPNDPLNWPLWKRDLNIFILSILALLASTLSPLLAADTVTLAINFRRPFTDMALLTGYHLLGVGFAGLLFVPSARIWGKRHIYLLGTLIVIISSAWGGGNGMNYASLLWARIFQGVGLAPFEALVNASVGDLYFVHERGVRLAMTNLCVFGGAFFTPVVVGVIADRLGYEWTFYFVAIFMAAMFPLLVLFCPETAYRRESKFDIDTMGNLIVLDKQEQFTQQADPANDAEKGTSPSNGVGESVTHTARSAGDTGKEIEQEEVRGMGESTNNNASPRKATWVQSLMPFNGRKTDERYLHLLLRPLPLFFHPGILWACLIQGALIGWTVMIGVVLAGIMLGPPLWFTQLQTGFMYTGAFVGALIGFGVCGLLTDTSARYMTKLNHGVYEPEFRMMLVIPQFVLGCAGLYGFGITAADAVKFGWFWPDFFFALVVAGMVCGAVGSAAYIVDAHRDMSVEGFTCLLVFKNIFSFALTFKSFDWLAQTGNVKDVFMAIASVQVGICFLTVPMYVLGKRNRSFWYRHNVFFKGADWVADRLTFW